MTDYVVHDATGAVVAEADSCGGAMNAVRALTAEGYPGPLRISYEPQVSEQQRVVIVG